jgi:hypothetical protein
MYTQYKEYCIIKSHNNCSNWLKNLNDWDDSLNSVWDSMPVKNTDLYTGVKKWCKSNDAEIIYHTEQDFTKEDLLNNYPELFI